MFLRWVTCPEAGAWTTRSALFPPISPGIPVLGKAVPSKYKRPNLCPRIVSITTSTSCGAEKPGPKAIVIGAIPRCVPKFFLAKIASITISGFNC